MDLNNLIHKASGSGFYANILNRILWRVIPFNKPHRFRIAVKDADTLQVLIPYRRSNLNHVKGLHACALATASEYVCGLSLARKLDPKKYRYILQKLDMEYTYQGKMDASASFTVSEEMLAGIRQRLENEEKIIVPLVVETFDRENNLLCRASTYWQIKEWSRVKTKM